MGSPRCPYSTVRKGMPEMCPAGRVGGQATQPGSTRTSSPTVEPGDRAKLARRHKHKGQTDKLRGKPGGQRYRPGVAALDYHVCENPLVIGRHTAEPYNL